MSLSKEQAIADHLRNVRASNVQSAATEAQWASLFTEYFANDGSASDSDTDSNTGSDTDIDRDMSGATEEGGSDSGGDIVDEAAVVMGTVNVVDDDGAAELLKVQAYTQLNDGQPCFTAFSAECVVMLRMNMSSMSSYDKDLVLLGKISSTICNVDMTTTSRRKEQTPRKQQRTTYSVEAKRVCREAFKFMHW